MRSLVSAVLVATALYGTRVHAQTAPAPAESDLPATVLTADLLTDAEQRLTKNLQASPADDDLRFALGTAQFLRGVERLMGSLYSYGLLTESNRLARNLPFLRLPVPENPAPKEVAYDDLRKVLSTFGEDLKTAEATLAAIKDDKVLMPLQVGLIKIDFNGDGKLAEDETLWRIFNAIDGPGQDGVTAEQAQDFTIAFDRGDVAWLRGYCHLIQAMTDIVLTYDAQRLFDSSAHLFFANPKSPHAFLSEAQPMFDMGMGVDVIDAIAIIHLLNLPVKDASRGPSAVEHLKAMTRLSRESWQAIMAETDDDREWLPNAKQRTVIPDVRAEQPMSDEWLTALDEMDRLLDGKVLLPFWRLQDGTGVNLQKMLAEPQPFDLVMYVKGAGATPFLEKGKPLTNAQTWDRLQRVFGGNLFGFAIWFN